MAVFLPNFLLFQRYSLQRHLKSIGPPDVWMTEWKKSVQHGNNFLIYRNIGFTPQSQLEGHHVGKPDASNAQRLP